MLEGIHESPMSPKDLTPNCVWHGASPDASTSMRACQELGRRDSRRGGSGVVRRPLALGEALAIQGLSIHELPDVRS